MQIVHKFVECSFAMNAGTDVPVINPCAFGPTQYGHENSPSTPRLAVEHVHQRADGMVKSPQAQSGPLKRLWPAAGTIGRPLALTVVLCLGAGLGSCGGFVSDHWPHWAGGEPNDLPPRPGAPGYEEFIAHKPKPDPSAATPETPGNSSAPAASADTSKAPAAPSANRPQDNQGVVQGGLY